MRSSVIIIGNPAARGSSLRKMEKAAELFRQRGYDAELLLTHRRGDAERLAAEYRQLNPGMIVAAGGDGTINEALNGIAGSDVPLAIIPMGTTNVLAKELGIPEDVAAAVEAAATKPARRVSLGRISVSRGDRYFCLMAGIGFDGSAVHGMNTAIKKVSGALAYVLSGVRGLVAYGPSELNVLIDGKAYQGYQAIIGKASKYGGHFRATPDAALTDPHFYVCIFRGKRRLDLLRYVVGIVRGAHLGYDDVVYVKADEIEVSGEAHIQIDGDYLGTTPARITVAPDAVRLIY